MGAKYYQMYLRGLVTATDVTAEDDNNDNEAPGINLDNFEDTEEESKTLPIVTIFISVMNIIMFRSSNSNVVKCPI